jgi:hypothetical protein
MSVYAMDEFYEWAGDILEEGSEEYARVTSDICVGEVVTNIVKRPEAGDAIWHEALDDFGDKLSGFEILRARTQSSKCARKVHEILDIQFKDKVWLTTAIDEGVTHVFTTDRGVFRNRTQLTAASQAVGGQAVKVHSPYR